MLFVLRFYSLLLHLYPASFRRQHAHDLRETFAMRIDELHGMLGVIVGIVMAIGDAIPNAIAAQFELVARDVRLAFRSMRRAPVLFGGALLILALGVGANGAVFSIVQAVLLQPLPYHEPERLAALWTTSPPPEGMTLSEDDLQNMARTVLSGRQLTAWREETKGVFSDIAGARIWTENRASQFDFDLGDHSERLGGAFVTPNFFEVLGVHAAIGRTIANTDDREHNSPIVISHGFWQRQFAGDSNVVGRTITLSTGIWKTRVPQLFTIVGVLPKTFRFTYPDVTDAWAMLPWAGVMSQRGLPIQFRTVARLAPGVSMVAAAERVKRLRKGLYTDTVHFERSETATLESISDSVIRDTRQPMLLLSGIALLLFVITCTTVANALFIRVAARKRELAVRAALGADPSRLMRQLVTEGALLALIGTAAGTLVAIAMMPVLRAFAPAGFPRADEIGVNKQIVFFAASAAALVVLLAAVAPAWRGRRVNLVTMLKRSSGTAFTDRATTRLARGLIGAQTAIATSLLIVAALLTISVWKLGHVSLGFDAERVFTFEMRMLDARYPDDPAQIAFQSALMSRIRETPGVLEAGLTTAVPFRGIDFGTGFTRLNDKKELLAKYRTVDAAFFSIMHLELVQGRLLNDNDNTSAPRVVVVSQQFAQKLFGSSNPLGQIIDGAVGKYTIIGVVRDVRYESREREPMSAIYFSAAQSSAGGLLCVIARVSGDVMPALRKSIASLNPGFPIMNVTTIDEIMSERGATRRFYTTAAIAFAILALTLTLTGLMLIVSRMIVERRRELAIRSALGASASTLVKHVMHQGLMPIVIGAAVGIVAAFNAAGFLSGFLFEVTPRNPVAYGSVAFLVLMAGAIAALGPALRATRARPAEALQAD